MVNLSDFVELRINWGTLIIMAAAFYSFIKNKMKETGGLPVASMGDMEVAVNQRSVCGHL